MELLVLYDILISIIYNIIEFDPIIAISDKVSVTVRNFITLNVVEEIYQYDYGPGKPYITIRSYIY